MAILLSAAVFVVVVLPWSDRTRARKLYVRPKAAIDRVAGDRRSSQHDDGAGCIPAWPFTTS